MQRGSYLDYVGIKRFDANGRPVGERRFLGLYDALRDAFTRYHDDLFDVRFWHAIQARLRAGEVLDIFPYPQSERLDSATLASVEYAI